MCFVTYESRELGLKSVFDDVELWSSGDKLKSDILDSSVELFMPSFGCSLFDCTRMKRVWTYMCHNLTLFGTYL